MARINWVRLILGGVIATIIAFLTDGLFHENVVSGDWKAVYANLGISEPQHTGLGVLYFAVFDLGRGLIEEINQATSKVTEDFHARYLEVFRLIMDRNEDMGWAFNDVRRSKAIILLANIKESGLLTEEESLQFSPETRESVEVIIKVRRM